MVGLFDWLSVSRCVCLSYYLRFCLRALTVACWLGGLRACSIGYACDCLLDSLYACVYACLIACVCCVRVGVLVD